ncbi:hypothetical protein [Bradyrhizobium sp. JYMT SZCCT0180]|uniref:hypothetical protein n=1 Tax=Bradyrhizobium sp. JYMT SZCCT0180 TaxID=2807666 RepID=UPI001BA7CB48|nr:hypothetical protein [Bradyrhizobium sp. JYMT SZCCT0180]MBR1214302.1 hypothetical protein [Bradyrhizobium sp. JYMT SZCCT0180]
MHQPLFRELRDVKTKKATQSNANGLPGDFNVYFVQAIEADAKASIRFNQGAAPHTTGSGGLAAG